MSQSIESLISAAEEYGASDLFLSEGRLARAKITGALHNLGDDPLTHEQLVEFAKACGADPEDLQDVDTAYLSESGVRFRVNLHRHTGRIGAVMRQIKNDIPDMESLGLPDHVLIPWNQAKSGLIIVTGSTGSGKSTTIASCLEGINRHLARHVVTIEDPIEYMFSEKESNFTQREVGTDTVSFPRGLKSSLRQAPDIIFLGEIRDAETATIGMQAAETGHVVFSTLHSSSVTDTLERIINLFPSADRDSALLLLSSQLIGVLTQQLLPTADGSSVVPVTEHLENVAAVRSWIRELKLAEIHEFMNRGDNPNNRTFMRNLVEATNAGLITREVGEAASSNAHEFSRALRGVS